MCFPSLAHHKDLEHQGAPGRRVLGPRRRGPSPEKPSTNVRRPRLRAPETGPSQLAAELTYPRPVPRRKDSADGGVGHPNKTMDICADLFLHRRSAAKQLPAASAAAAAAAGRTRRPFHVPEPGGEQTTAAFRVLQQDLPRTPPTINLPSYQRPQHVHSARSGCRVAIRTGPAGQLVSEPASEAGCSSGIMIRTAPAIGQPPLPNLGKELICRKSGLLV
jgi:hypothetical protein